MRSIEAPTVGLTISQKKPATRMNRHDAIPSITSTSFTNTERYAGVGAWSRAGVSVTIAADETVAEAAHRLDVLRSPRIVPELLPQPRNEHVDRAVVALPVETTRRL